MHVDIAPELRLSQFPPNTSLSQLPREHITHAAIKYAKRYSNIYPSRPVRFS